MGVFDLSYLFFFPCSLERLGFFFFLFFFFFFYYNGYALYSENCLDFRKMTYNLVDESNNVIFNTAESLYFFFFLLYF